jgi:hypothetical protein
MVATQVAASIVSVLAPQPTMDAKKVTTPVHETDTVRSADRDFTEESTTGTEKHNAMDEADTISNTESSTAEEVAKEPLAAALAKSENVEQSNQDLQDGETSMEQSQSATARLFPSVVANLFIPNEMLNFTWNSAILIIACAILIYFCSGSRTSRFIGECGVE